MRIAAGAATRRRAEAGSTIVIRTYFRRDCTVEVTLLDTTEDILRFPNGTSLHPGPVYVAAQCHRRQGKTL